jgi:signal peptidase I
VRKVLGKVAAALGVGASSEKDFIKRVIGTPGDRVACCVDGHVTVQPKGSKTAVPLDEPYLYQDDKQVFCAAGIGDQECPKGAPGVLVPEGRLWVMGDHRGFSSDSRAHIKDENSGTVPIDKVIGRAFVIVWPVGRSTVLRVPETFDTALGTPAALAVGGAPYLLGLVGAVPVVSARRRLRNRLRNRPVAA